MTIGRGNGPGWGERFHRPAGLAVAAFLGVKLASLAVNLHLFPTLRPPDHAGNGTPSDGMADVTLLIPVRDEAHRLPTTLPGLLNSGARLLVFLDDESTDGTADLIRAAARIAPSGVTVRVLDGTTRPDGWRGKTWACAQLAEATDAGILVFCDADVVLRPGAVAAIAVEMDRQGVQVFSVFARQLVGGWGERLLVPLITDVVLCFLPFPLLRAPVPAAATASGALLAFRRPAYERLGGFAAVRDQTVEDVAIARRARRLGVPLGLALGGALVQVRMYESYGDLVAGLGRGLTPVAGGRRSLVVVGLLVHLVVYTAPAVLMIRASRWRTLFLAGVLERLLVEAKTGGRDWAAAVFVAASPLAAIPVVARAMRRNQTWKNRSYPT